MSTPTVPDGPDTELAAAIDWMRSDRRRQLVSLVSGPDGDETERAVATILRAVLDRPAAGRDLTAPDVHDAVVAWNVAPGEPDRDQFLADRLNAVARPAVARTDGQPSADKLVAAARSVVDLMDRTVDMPGVVRDVVDNLRDALAAAPADDTAAPASPHSDGCRTLAEHGGVCGRQFPGAPDCVIEDAVDLVTGALDESISDFVDLRDRGEYDANPREAARLAVEALAATGWRGPADDTAPPDAPDVWDHCTAPGGYVCGACGTPTESEPCSEHQPASTARMQNGGVDS